MENGHWHISLPVFLDEKRKPIITTKIVDALDIIRRQILQFPYFLVDAPTLRFFTTTLGTSFYKNAHAKAVCAGLR